MQTIDLHTGSETHKMRCPSVWQPVSVWSECGVVGLFGLYKYSPSHSFHRHL